MHQLARLSRGRNNGDGSWSLASDELDDLEYLTPEGMGDVLSLSIRIIGLDQDGTTLAIVEVPISTGGQLPDAKGAVSTAAISREQDAIIQRQRDELASLKFIVAEREAELADARRMADSARDEPSRDILASELSAARESWKRELEGLLTDAATRATQALEQAQAGWHRERADLIAKAEKQAEDRLARTQELSQGATKDLLARAEAGWKVAEAKRVANAESIWREKSARALAEATARSEQAEKALSNALANTSAKPARDEGETRRLREELANSRATVAERDKALSEALATAAQERERLQRAQAVSLVSAKTSWVEAERARIAKAEDEWRRKSECALGELMDRCSRAETALARNMREPKQSRNRGGMRRTAAFGTRSRYSRSNSPIAMRRSNRCAPTRKIRSSGRSERRRPSSQARKLAGSWKNPRASRPLKPVGAHSRIASNRMLQPGVTASKLRWPKPEH